MGILSNKRHSAGISMTGGPLDNDGNRFPLSRLPSVSYRRYPAKADLAASLVAAQSTLREILHYTGEDALA